MGQELNRRAFLKFGASAAGGAAVALASSGAFAKSAAAACGATPPQTPGPFYPGESEFRADADLTQIEGHAQRASGQVALLSGRVVDGACRPVAGAAVEIWQACASGRYDNPKDDNPAPLDPHFKYWGEAFTNADGEYAFKTIKPGAYPAGDSWVRPPHIHFKVTKLGYRELVTQLYFKGEPLNDVDLILLGVPAGERDRVIVEFAPSPGLGDPAAIAGRFDIALRSVR